MVGRIAGRFARVEPRRRARFLLLGLLVPLPRKNRWTLAEHAWDANADGMQHPLARAVWDADAVRDDLRYVVEDLEDRDAVLVVDETGDLKKGAGSIAGARCAPPRTADCPPPAGPGSRGRCHGRGT